LAPVIFMISNGIGPHSLTRVPGIGYFYGLFRAAEPAFAPGLNQVTKNKPQKPQSFEAALAEIESIVASMEGGELPLEQSLAAYKRGAELLQYCQAQLRDAQQQVKVLESGALQNFSSDDSAE
jgi:exodeoxyribonuclease VII small subunit